MLYAIIFECVLPRFMYDRFDAPEKLRFRCYQMTVEDIKQQCTTDTNFDYLCSMLLFYRQTYGLFFQW